MAHLRFDPNGTESSQGSPYHPILPCSLHQRILVLNCPVYSVQFGWKHNFILLR